MDEFGLDEATALLFRNYFAAQPDITQVKIYGSRANGTFKRGSDIDFAIYTKKPDILGRIMTEIDYLPTIYRCDVTDYSSITHAPLKAHIDEFGKIFYQRAASQQKTL